MYATSPLHWLFSKDLNGKVYIQSKLTCDDDKWSMQHYPWTDAPRPNNRKFEQGTSGMRPSDLSLCPANPLSDRRRELKQAMKKVQFRITKEEWLKVLAVFNFLRDDKHLEQLELAPVPNGGLFLNETDDPLQFRNPRRQTSQDLFLRDPSRIFDNTNQQAIDRENRKARGRAKSALIVNNYVALTVNYVPETRPQDRQDFWVGRILQLNKQQRMVRIQYFNTGCTKNLTGQQAKYHPWLCNVDGITWIDVDCVLHTFEEFTPTGMISAPDKRIIKHALALAPDPNEPNDGDPQQRSQPQRRSRLGPPSHSSTTTTTST